MVEGWRRGKRMLPKARPLGLRQGRWSWPREGREKSSQGQEVRECRTSVGRSLARRGGRGGRNPECSEESSPLESDLRAMGRALKRGVT